VDLGVQQFDMLYKESNPCPLGEIMTLINKYPWLVEENENDDLYKEVSKDDLHEVLSMFCKDYSPGLDSWMIEFFEALFDLLG